MMQQVLAIVGAVVAVLALVGSPIGIYVSMRERATKADTVIEELRGTVNELKAAKAKADETAAAAVATLRRELIDEMRRADDRVSTTDGERDSVLHRELRAIGAKVDRMASKVDQNHGMLWALVRHTKASDPRFQIPPIMMAAVSPNDEDP